MNSKLDNTKRLFSGITESVKPNNTKERRGYHSCLDRLLNLLPPLRSGSLKIGEYY